MNVRQLQRGFTMIELLVVIAIIGILASAVMIMVQDAYAKSRDSIRLADLDTAAKALVRYNLNNGNWMETGSGCGYNGDGNGWFSHSGSGYPESMSNCLHSAGFTESPLVDPSGATMTTGDQSGYMKYTCGTGTNLRIFLYAELESAPTDSTATDGTCCPSCDSDYDMNYYQEIII